MIRVLVSENEPGDAEGLIEALGDAGDIQVVGVARDGIECVMMVNQLHPDIALVRADMAAIDGFRAARLISLTAPDTQPVLVAGDESAVSTLTPQAMLAGMRAVIHPKARPDYLLPLLQSLVDEQPTRKDDDYLLVSDPNRLPTMIAVTGSKGGIGKTTTATNLALAMEQRFPDQVIVVDFVGHYGDISLMLNLTPQNSILDLAGKRELDAEVIAPMIVKHSSGLQVMAGVNSADTLNATGQLSLANVSSLLGVLRRKFRIIVIDVPALVYPLSQYIYHRSNYICLLTCLAELTTIHSTVGLMQSLLSQGIPPERIKIVVSRYNPQDSYSPAQLEQSLKHPVAVKVPLDWAVATAALNQGVPYTLGKPNSAPAMAVQELADLLVRDIEAAVRAAGRPNS